MKSTFKLSILPLTVLISILTFSCTAQEDPIVAEGAQVTLVAADYEFTEGPAVDTNGNVFFTDQPNDRIIKWSADDNTVSVYLEPAGRANGLYFDHDGNLLACADEKFQLWKIDSNKNVTVLIDDFKGKKLNGPNDLWVDAKGGIYFTDPYYQRPYWERTQGEIEKRNVYYLTPDMKDIIMVANDLAIQSDDRPAKFISSFIPDQETAYIGVL